MFLNMSGHHTNDKKLLTNYSKTSAPIGAWKSNFPPLIDSIIDSKSVPNIPLNLHKFMVKISTCTKWMDVGSRNTKEVLSYYNYKIFLKLSFSWSSSCFLFFSFFLGQDLVKNLSFMYSHLCCV